MHTSGTVIAVDCDKNVHTRLTVMAVNSDSNMHTCGTVMAVDSESNVHICGTLMAVDSDSNVQTSGTVMTVNTSVTEMCRSLSQHFFCQCCDRTDTEIGVNTTSLVSIALSVVINATLMAPLSH